MCSYVGKDNRNISSLPDPAVQTEIGVMILGDMLDNRQPQPGSAGSLGAAFIHSEKPLKHSGLILRRDADPGIFHGNRYASIACLNRKLPSAAVNVVFDRIIYQVIEHFIQETPHSIYHQIFA